MLSLKADQNDAINNINALLNGKDTKEGLIDALKSEIRKLSLIHADMQETQAFILQMTKGNLEAKASSKQEEEQ